MTRLAVLGGSPAVPRAVRHVQWPVVTDADKEAVLRVLDSGAFVSNADAETPVSSLEREWSDHFGFAHSVAVANGTAALSLALAATGVGPGDEVIVPALTFIATALAPLHHMAIPVFADVDPVTFTLDPDDVERRITSRTRAIIPVHLHGAAADMRRLGELAHRYGLRLVEDAAQAPGALHRGTPVGGIGDMGAFSLQTTKNIPTCGEGGLVVTQDPDLAATARIARQFGEVIEPGRDRDYISYRLGWNHKMNGLQAEFARGQLLRFPEYEQLRQANVARFLKRLEGLPGLQVPRPLPGTTHAWHILRFRFSPERAGIPEVSPSRFRAALHRVLRAEGLSMSRYQLMPLSEQKVFQDREGFGRGYPWAAAPPDLDGPLEGAAEQYPVAHAVIGDSLTLQKRHLNPGSHELLQFYADGFEKVWGNLEVVARIAGAKS